MYKVKLTRVLDAWEQLSGSPNNIDDINMVYTQKQIRKITKIINNKNCFYMGPTKLEKRKI